MRLSLILLGVMMSLGVVLFTFQPKNIEGPRVTPVVLKQKGFPYHTLNRALKVAFPEEEQVGPRYDLLRAQPQALDHYLGLMSELGPRNTPHRFTQREQRLAYLLNAYTAGFLALVRDACPLHSVDDPYWFGGLFWRVSLRVGGEALSLNDIASEINTLMRGDQRAFLALHKGYQSDLPMRREAWIPERVDESFDQLEAQLLAPPYVERDGDTLKLSVIFKWYQHYFQPHPKGYIKVRRPELVKGIKKIIFQEPDRALRGQCGP